MNGDFKDVPVLAKLEEVAEWLVLSKRKVWQMGRDRVIRINKVGRSVRYCLREYMEKIHGIRVQ